MIIYIIPYTAHEYIIKMHYNLFFNLLIHLEYAYQDWCTGNLAQLLKEKSSKKVRSSYGICGERI